MAAKILFFVCFLALQIASKAQNTNNEVNINQMANNVPFLGNMGNFSNNPFSEVNNMANFNNIISNGGVPGANFPGMGSNFTNNIPDFQNMGNIAGIGNIGNMTSLPGAPNIGSFGGLPSSFSGESVPGISNMGNIAGIGNIGNMTSFPGLSGSPSFSGGSVPGFGNMGTFPANFGNITNSIQQVSGK